MSKSTTIWILGDQLNPRISALEGVAPSECVVLMIQSLAIARWLPYHKQKLALVWSAMRHFAQELRELGYEVDYCAAQPHLKPALEVHMAKHHPGITTGSIGNTHQPITCFPRSGATNRTRRPAL